VVLNAAATAESANRRIASPSLAAPLVERAREPFVASHDG
jgi:hypothetical protein